MEAHLRPYFHHACKMWGKARQSNPKPEILHKISSKYQNPWFSEEVVEFNFFSYKSDKKHRKIDY